MGRRLKLRVREVAALRHVRDMVERDPGGMGRFAALNCLEVLDWERLGSPSGCLESRWYVHKEAIPGYILADGTGRILFTLENLIFMNRTPEVGIRFHRLMALQRGIHALDEFLKPELESAVDWMELFA